MDPIKMGCEHFMPVKKGKRFLCFRIVAQRGLVGFWKSFWLATLLAMLFREKLLQADQLI